MVAAVPVVLGRVVVRRVGECLWSGRRIQANHAAALGELGSVSIDYYFDRSPNDAVRASKILQESTLRERLVIVGVKCYCNVINRSSDRFSRRICRVVGVLERVELVSDILTIFLST